MTKQLEPLPILAVNDKEAAGMMGISRMTLRSHMKAGRIAYACVGHRALIPVESLKQFLAASIETPPTQQKKSTRKAPARKG